MNTGSNPILSLMSVGDVGHIYITQNYESMAFADMLCQVLNENEVHAEIADTVVVQADCVKPAEFAGRGMR